MDICASQRAEGIGHKRLISLQSCTEKKEHRMTQDVTRHKDDEHVTARCTSPAQRCGEELVEQAVVVLHELGRDAELVI
jgi:hypothetical protein